MIGSEGVNSDGCHEAVSLKGTHHTSSTDRRHHPAGDGVTVGEGWEWKTAGKSAVFLCIVNVLLHFANLNYGPISPWGLDWGFSV